MKTFRRWRDLSLSFALHAALIMLVLLFAHWIQQVILPVTQIDVTVFSEEHLGAPSANSQKNIEKSQKTSEISNSAQSPAPQANEQKQGSGVASNVKNAGMDAASAESTYLSTIRAQILAHQHYPLTARKQHLEGLIEVKIKIDSAGRLLNKTLISPGKSSILEKAALEALEQSAPFPALPAAFSGDFLIPINFSLKK